MTAVLRRQNEMWVSRRADYASRAVLALALEPGRLLRLDEIAAATDSPRSVLEQVLPVLRNAGIVRAVRGPAGGYRLNREPEEITLEQVIRLFHGQLAPIGYATRRNPDPCPDLVARSLRETWVEVRDATIEILATTTFADLAASASGARVA